MNCNKPVGGAYCELEPDHEGLCLTGLPQPGDDEGVPDPVPDPPNAEVQIRQLIVESSGTVLTRMVEALAGKANPVRMLALIETYAASTRSLVAEMNDVGLHDVGDDADILGAEDAEEGPHFGRVLGGGRRRRIERAVRRARRLDGIGGLAHGDGYVAQGMLQDVPGGRQGFMEGLGAMIPALNENTRAQQLRNLLQAAQAAQQIGDVDLHNKLMDEARVLTDEPRPAEPLRPMAPRPRRLAPADVVIDEENGNVYAANDDELGAARGER